jgi:hypothetical protein
VSNFSSPLDAAINSGSVPTKAASLLSSMLLKKLHDLRVGPIHLKRRSRLRIIKSGTVHFVFAPNFNRLLAEQLLNDLNAT